MRVLRYVVFASTVVLEYLDAFRSKFWTLLYTGTLCPRLSAKADTDRFVPYVWCVKQSASRQIRSKCLLHFSVTLFRPHQPRTDLPIGEKKSKYS